MLCFACSQADNTPEAAVCHDTFSPPPELQETFEEAAYQWHQAIGRNICIRPGGVPVSLVPEIVYDGSAPCGTTTIEAWAKQYDSTTGMEISLLAFHPQCHSPLHVVMHEMGHSLAHGWAIDPWHTTRGLMAAEANDSDTIDLDALYLICKRSDCW